MRTTIYGREDGDSYGTSIRISSISGTNISDSRSHFRDSGVITGEVIDYFALRTARKVGEYDNEWWDQQKRICLNVTATRANDGQ